MMKMDPHVKKKWIFALTDGGYSQTQHALKDQKGYCCLGVLCDVLSNEGFGEWQKGSGSLPYDAQKFVDVSGDNNECALTKAIVEVAGLLEEDITFYVGDLSTSLQKELSKYKNKMGHGDKLSAYKKADYTSLAGLNDSGVPFEVIAKVIDELV